MLTVFPCVFNNVSETSSTRKINVNVVEISLVGQAPPDLSFLWLCVNDFFVVSPFRIILHERLFEINLKIELIVIWDSDTF